MKKLMIAAAIVCAAVISHAATFDWSVESGLKNESGSTASDYIGFGFFKSGNNVPTYTVEQAVAMVMANEFPESLMSTVGVADGGAFGLAEAFDAGASVASGEYEGFIVLVNATATDFEGGTYAPTMYSVIEGGATAKQTITSAGQAATFRFASTQQGDWKSVPEPTSGLLLLLGVAGLALRRRRA